MDSANQNQSGAAPAPKQQIDFGATKSISPTKPVDSKSSVVPQKTSAPQSSSSAPTPVMSAKAAINAMYANQSSQPHPEIVMSAREAVNAAARQDGVQHTKSASNLHHGSIQRSMESTRTSASALLRRATDETKVDTHAGSLDPLVKAQPTSAIKRSEREIPVVRTSLKLGTAARPKPTPVVLPPNARMAQVARPVKNLADTPAPKSKSNKLVKFLRRGTLDTGVTKTRSISQGAPIKALSSGRSGVAVSDENALTVKIIPSSPAPKPAASRPAAQRRKVSASRDPQMRAGARRSQSHAQNLASTAASAEVLNVAPSRRFRTKPKGFSTAKPTALPTDNSYIMAEPPKLSTKRQPAPPEEADLIDDLGVVESYHSANANQTSQTAQGYKGIEYRPQPAGDHAPTGSIKAQTVASGHVAAIQDGLSATPTIKADNTSDYSFSQKKAEPDNNRYSLGGESPFLRSVNVEKRPLSNSPKKLSPKVERRSTVGSTEIAKKSTLKPGRKNQYPKGKAMSTPRQDLPTRPTVIVPSNRRSKAPLFFLVLITIILGAAVGAAVYLCFFQ